MKTTFNWAKARRIMSKTLCSVMIATAIVSFSSCSDDDDDDNNNNGGGTTSQFTSLQVNVANGSQYTDIATVVAGDLDEPYSNVANYNNGNFTLQMLTPAAEDLYLFAEGVPSTVTFSDASVKIAMFDDIACYDANADQIADISYHSGHSEVTFIYADRDCNVTGTYSEEDYIQNINLQLKKGWNKMYLLANADETVITGTTTPQSGFQWDIDYWDTDTEKTSAQRPETKGFGKF